MAVRKTAIAIPEALLTDVDRCARERGESRSRYITRVLEVAVRARRDADITRRLDELFADQKLLEDQRKGARVVSTAETGWNDERW